MKSGYRGPLPGPASRVVRKEAELKMFPVITVPNRAPQGCWELNKEPLKIFLSICQVFITTKVEVWFNGNVHTPQPPWDTYTQALWKGASVGEGREE